MTIQWPDLCFPAINLWSLPRQPNLPEVREEDEGNEKQENEG